MGHIRWTLFGDAEEGGMSLVWSWFGPDYPLPRHSHSTRTTRPDDPGSGQA
jgi:hypothetical protein